MDWSKQLWYRVTSSSYSGHVTFTITGSSRSNGLLLSWKSDPTVAGHPSTRVPVFISKLTPERSCEFHLLAVYEPCVTGRLDPDSARPRALWKYCPAAVDARTYDYSPSFTITNTLRTTGSAPSTHLSGILCYCVNITLFERTGLLIFTAFNPLKASSDGSARPRALDI